jgi:hypothetical protein
LLCIALPSRVFITIALSHGLVNFPYVTQSTIDLEKSRGTTSGLCQASIHPCFLGRRVQQVRIS